MDSVRADPVATLPWVGSSRKSMVVGGLVEGEQEVDSEREGGEGDNDARAVLADLGQEERHDGKQKEGNLEEGGDELGKVWMKGKSEGRRCRVWSRAGA